MSSQCSTLQPGVSLSQASGSSHDDQTEYGTPPSIDENPLRPEYEPHSQSQLWSWKLAQELREAHQARLASVSVDEHG